MRVARARCLAAALACVAVMGALAVCPGPAYAAPLSVRVFASRLDDAHSLVTARRDALDTTTSAASLADGVDALLPAATSVLDGTRTIAVDLTSVTATLRDLRVATTTAARRDAAGRLDSRLLALRWAMGVTRPGPADPADPEALRSLVAAIPHAASNTGADWLNEQTQKVLDRIARWIDSLAPRGSSPQSVPSRLIMLLVLAVPAVLALIVLVRALRARRRLSTAGPLPDSTAPAGTPAVAAAADLPVDALGYADRLAAAGAHRDAVRALYGGAARHLVEAGAVTRMRTRTNLEMVRDVSAAAPALATPFAALTREFERAWYGHAEPGESGFVRARSVYERVVDTVEASGAADGTVGPSGGEPR